MDNPEIDAPSAATPRRHGQSNDEKASSLQVWTLLALLAVMPFSFELIFPFINQFLLHIGVVDDPADAGFYSGITESVFAVTQLITIFPATRLSDTYGRKPVVLIGSLGVGISMALFGLSTKFWMMVLFRALGGGIGGSNTALRVMGSELAYTKEEESRIITHMSISFRLGQIVGQPVGGGLSHPEKRWPRLFGNPFWRSFPYALPCFVGAAYAVITVIVGQIVLKETLSSKGPKPDPTAGNLGNTDHTETTPLISENTRSTSDPMILQSTPSSPSILSALTWPLLSLLLSSAAMTLITEIFFAVYPLFAFTPVELGGLGLSEAEIGVHMSTRSILLVCGLFFFTKLEKRFGRLAVYRLSLVAWIPTIMLFPILNWIVRGHGGGKGGLIWYLAFFTLFTLWSITGWSWTAIYLLGSEHSQKPESKATVQGFITTSIIGPQAIAPALGTSLFAISVNNPDILDGRLFWTITLAFAIAMTVHSFTIYGVASESSTSREDESRRDQHAN